MSVHALLLNASFEPIRVISARKALDLIKRGVVEAVEPDGKIISQFRAETDWVDIPAVLRMKYQVKVPFRAVVPLNRKAILARDKSMCQFSHCNRVGDSIDHVMPRSKGGKHEWTNVVTACKRCNAKKDDKLMKELGWSLKRQPFAPKGWFYVVFRFSVDEAWLPYLPEAA